MVVSNIISSFSELSDDAVDEDSLLRVNRAVEGGGGGGGITSCGLQLPLCNALADFVGLRSITIGFPVPKLPVLREEEC